MKLVLLLSLNLHHPYEQQLLWWPMCYGLSAAHWSSDQISGIRNFMSVHMCMMDPETCVQISVDHLFAFHAIEWISFVLLLILLIPLPLWWRSYTVHYSGLPNLRPKIFKSTWQYELSLYVQNYFNSHFPLVLSLFFFGGSIRLKVD